MSHESGWPDEPAGYEVFRDGRREAFWTSLDTGEREWDEEPPDVVLRALMDKYDTDEEGVDRILEEKYRHLQLGRDG